MSTAAVLIAGPSEPRGRGANRGRRRAAPPAGRERAAVDAARTAGFDEIIVVVDAEERAAAFPEDATLLLDESEAGSARALHAALDWSARAGHEAVVVVALGEEFGTPDPSIDTRAWRALVNPARSPIVALRVTRRVVPFLRLDAEVWSLVPLEGDLMGLLGAKPELVTEIEPDLSPTADGPRQKVNAAAAIPPVDAEVVGGEWASEEDVAAVESLLGRPAAGRFTVVVRDRAGSPVVIRNAPFLDDRTPMPTRYWLVGRRERELVGQLESTGGVDRAEREIDPVELAEAHDRYARERDAEVPADHVGPLPSGGVGGTRVGVKCLHAHLAWYLAGGSDPVGRWVTRALAGSLEGAVAAIDCGTNSTRLLVAGRDGETLDRQMTVTRLGESVDETRTLADAAIERTLETLRRYRATMDAHGVVALRATATSAARDATNSAVFFDGAEAVLGVRPELLSGAEEGALSYRGATNALDPAAGPYLVCDLGGGSTELVAGKSSGELAAVRSLNVGCVRVTERFLHSDPPAPAEIAAARSFVGEEVGRAVVELPELGSPRSMVGVAGTVSTLVALRYGVEHYDREALHHRSLTRSDVEALLGRLADAPLARRRALPGIEAGRADVIVGGALILAEVMGVLGHDSLVYSEDDILDGLVASLLAPART